MLTDAEMTTLLDMREHQDDPAPAATLELTVQAVQYLLALDAALPQMVEEVRRLRAEIKEWNEYVAVMCGGNPKEKSHD